MAPSSSFQPGGLKMDPPTPTPTLAMKSVKALVDEQLANSVPPLNRGEFS